MFLVAMTLMRVKHIRRETDDVRVFHLERCDGESLPAFTPGAHIDVHLDDRLVRQYSLCNGPEETRAFVIGVKREVLSRGGSAAMHEKIQLGDILPVGGPRNAFELHAQAAHHVLVAGGIGITPLLSMCRHLLASDASFVLHYFARSASQAPFHHELSASRYAGRVAFHYGQQPEEVRAQLRDILQMRAPQAHLYLCGPRPFMDAAQHAAAASWPSEAVHFEYFSPDAQGQRAPHDAFVVRLARTGGDYLVPPDMSIVQALSQHGVSVDVSCEQGMCGTCLTSVLDGKPDHRDSFLSEEERLACDKLLPCVSRACSDVLVLDL